MIDFTVEVQELDGTEDAPAKYTNRAVHKRFSWPILPRIGEDMGLEGDTYPVLRIDHDLSKPEAGITIYTEADTVSYEDLRDHCPGWEVCGAVRP